LATRSTFVARAISMLTFAVIPGLSFNSLFGTSITVAYVTTFCWTSGLSRTCDTFPLNSSAG
jgi:hypothetical protein